MELTLLTGGLGFVGRQVTPKLLDEEQRVALFVRDSNTVIPQLVSSPNIQLVDLPSLGKFVCNHQISTVINLAGKYTFNPKPGDVAQVIASNLSLPLELAHAIAASGQSPTWIQASSFMQDFEGLKHQAMCFYAACKDATETGLKYFEFAHGFKVINLVLPHIYGSHDPRPKVIPSLIRAARNGDLFHMTSGDQLMDLVHVEDVASALLHARSLNPGRWHVSSGELVALKSVVSFLEARTESGFKALFNPQYDRPFDMYFQWPNQQVLPNWVPSRNFWDWLEIQLSELHEFE